MEGGFIKLYRELFRKPIWTGSTPQQRCVLITLLEMAVLYGIFAGLRTGAAVPAKNQFYAAPI